MCKGLTKSTIIFQAGTRGAFYFKLVFQPFNDVLRMFAAPEFAFAIRSSKRRSISMPLHATIRTFSFAPSTIIPADRVCTGAALYRNTPHLPWIMLTAGLC